MSATHEVQEVSKPLLNAARAWDPRGSQGREGPVTSSTGTEEPLPSSYWLQLNTSASMLAGSTINPLTAPHVAHNITNANDADRKTALLPAKHRAGLATAWDNLAVLAAANGIPPSSLLSILQDGAAQDTSLNHKSAAEPGHLHFDSFTARHTMTQLQQNPNPVSISKPVSTTNSSFNSQHKVCVICNTKDTPMWRKLDSKGANTAANTLCNKCYMYRRNHGTLPAPTSPAVPAYLPPTKTQGATSISSSVACATGSAVHSMHLPGPAVVAPDTPQAAAATRHNTTAVGKEAASPKARRQRSNSPDYDYVPRGSSSSRSASASPKQSRRTSTASLGDRSQASSQQRSRLGRSASGTGTNFSTTASKRTRTGSSACVSIGPFSVEKRTRYYVGLAASAALLADAEEAAIMEAAEVLVELGNTHATLAGGVQEMFADESGGMCINQDCVMDLDGSAAAMRHAALHDGSFSTGLATAGAELVHHTCFRNDVAVLSQLQDAELVHGGLQAGTGSTDLIMIQAKEFNSSADTAHNSNIESLPGTTAPVSSSTEMRPSFGLEAESLMPRLQPVQLSMSGGDGLGKNFGPETTGTAIGSNMPDLASFYTGIRATAEMAAPQMAGGSSTSSASVALAGTLGATAMAGAAQHGSTADMSITSIADQALAAEAAGQISADVCISYLAGLVGGMHGAGPAGLDLTATQAHFEAMQQQLVQSPELKQLLVQLTGTHR